MDSSTVSIANIESVWFQYNKLVLLENFLCNAKSLGWICNWSRLFAKTPFYQILIIWICKKRCIYCVGLYCIVFCGIYVTISSTSHQADHCYLMQFISPKAQKADDHIYTCKTAENVIFVRIQRFRRGGSLWATPSESTLFANSTVFIIGALCVSYKTDVLYKLLACRNTGRAIVLPLASAALAVATAASAVAVAAERRR